MAVHLKVGIKGVTLTHSVTLYFLLTKTEKNYIESIQKRELLCIGENAKGVNAFDISKDLIYIVHWKQENN